MSVANSRVSQRCCASQAHACEVVTTAVFSWARLYMPFGSLPKLPSPGLQPCSGFWKEMKKLIGFGCPSSSSEATFAWQSIKKLFPDSCQCMESSLLEGLADVFLSSSVELPPGYLSFVETQCRSLFKKQWDRHYPDHCLRASPPLKSVLEASLSEGGSHGLGHDRILYLSHVLDGEPFEASIKAKAMVVQSAGKPRPLTKFSSDALLVKPLHDTLYDHISRRNWVLRGEPDKAKFNEAGFRENGSWLVSGDYKSSTDGLSIEVAEVILQTARQTAFDVPDCVWEYALALLRPEVEFPQGSARVVRGQMMGSYLSFPLLCIQNWLAFNWARTVHKQPHMPVIVNGDDILFECPDFTFYEKWIQTVKTVGFDVELTKTHVSPVEGSINSTLLRWDSKGRLDVCPTPRFGVLKGRDFAVGLGRDFAGFVKSVPPELAFQAAKEFFKWHVSSMRRMGNFDASELGFRGRLALRMAKIFGLFKPVHRYLRVPLPPARHDVVIPQELVTRVPKGSLSDELIALNCAEMTCWKWSHTYSPASGMIKYCVTLSSIRPRDEPDVRVEHPFDMSSALRARLTPPTTTQTAKLYFRPTDESEVMLFNELLALQDFSAYEPLPPYAQIELEFFHSNSEAPSELVKDGAGAAALPSRAPDIRW